MNIPDFKIESYLIETGIKPSYQRLKIYEYLVRYQNHPTVDDIYKELVVEIPTLSKTTVYNTLKLFIDKKIVKLLMIEENETRYDADISTHGHFKCNECRKIYDIKIDVSTSNVEGLEKFKVDEKHIYFKGTCEGCI